MFCGRSWSERRQRYEGLCSGASQLQISLSATKDNKVSFCWRICILSRKAACLTMPAGLCLADKQTAEECYSTSAAASAVPCPVGCCGQPVKRSEFPALHSRSSIPCAGRRLGADSSCHSCNHTQDAGNMLASCMFTEGQTFTQGYRKAFPA